MATVTVKMNDRGRQVADNLAGRKIRLQMCLTSREKRSLLYGCCLAFVSTPLAAAEWDISESVSLNEVYTDNINLDGTGKKSKFITQLSPSLSLTGKGSGASVTLTASARYDTGGNSGGSITPNVSGKANAELMPDHLFLDADVSVSQNAIDPYGDIGIDNVSNTGNVTTTIKYALSPYYKNRIRGVGDLEARYRYVNTSHSESGASGGGSHEITASLSSGTELSRLNWGANGSYKKNSSSGTSGQDLRSADVTLGYRFNRKWSVDSSIGREWNDFDSTRSSTGGNRWTLNTTWTPNSRTSLRIGYGNRFFGSTPSLDLSYKSRRSTITAGYSKIVTDANSQLDALAIDTASGRIFPIAILIDDVFVDERFAGSWSLQGKRTTLTLSGSQSKQVYQNSPQQSELTTLGLGLTRTISGRVSANASLNWYQQDRSSSDSAETWQGTVGLSVKLGRKTSMNLSYTYNKRDDEQPANSYEENRATLGVSYTL